MATGDIERRLKGLRHWSMVDGRLHRTYKFPSFVKAFAFMTAGAIEAEKLNHHPEWSNVYSTVKVDLSTHDAGGITELDFELAERLDSHA